ncbi:MAG: hypothetical protein ACYS8Z_22550 [Planctomycetota bacterium]|jgi:hypothetical protein
MKLKTAGRIRNNNVTRSDIIQAFEDDKGRGEFIILSQSTQVYIQAAGEDYGPYILEYRDGGAHYHFQCSEELPKPQIQEAFIKYLEGDQSWKTSLEWKPLEMVEQESKPWWKFW